MLLEFCSCRQLCAMTQLCVLQTAVHPTDSCVSEIAVHPEIAVPCRAQHLGTGVSQAELCATLCHVNTGTACRQLCSLQTAVHPADSCVPCGQLCAIQPAVLPADSPAHSWAAEEPSAQHHPSECQCLGMPVKLLGTVFSTSFLALAKCALGSWP